MKIGMCMFLWTTHVTADHEVLLRDIKATGFDGVEVLWSLHPDAWSQGYATEAARAALSYGFNTLELDSIFAITLEENRASRSVMERIGLTYRKRVDYKGFADIVWYDVDRATYAERMSSAAR